MTRAQTARRGAALGLIASAAYGAAFVAYAFARSAVALADQVDTATVGATWSSLLIACLAFVVLLMPLTGGLGAGIALVTRAILLRRAVPPRWTGAVVAAAFAIVVLALVHGALGVGSPLRFVETYVFWLAAPIALCIGLAAWSAPSFVEASTPAVAEERKAA